MCFLSSNISVFPTKTTISISRPHINLARLNWVKFDSHVAFIEGRKVVIQLIYCKTFPCLKKHNYRKTGLTKLFIVEPRERQLTTEILYIDYMSSEESDTKKTVLQERRRGNLLLMQRESFLGKCQI